MKLGAIALMFVLPMAWIDGPPTQRVTTKDYREILQMLRGIDDTLEELEDDIDGEPQKDDCRGLSPEKTVRCAAQTFGVSEEQAVSVWQCESGWGIEPDGPMGHSYHGPMQYLPSTYLAQQAAIPDVVQWYELSPAVHDMRSNIMTAVAWASRYGWGPWGCA